MIERESKQGTFEIPPDLKQTFIRPFILFFFFFIFCLYRATPAAYRGSQARGLIRAAAAAYARATAKPDPSRDLHHSSRQHRILNPLHEARDQTRNLTVPSRIR